MWNSVFGKWRRQKEQCVARVMWQDGTSPPLWNVSLCHCSTFAEHHVDSKHWTPVTQRRGVRIHSFVIVVSHKTPTGLVTQQLQRAPKTQQLSAKGPFKAFGASSDARALRAHVHEQITLSEYFPFGSHCYILSSPARSYCVIHAAGVLCLAISCYSS